MKEEALKQHAGAVEAAAGALYDAGFADGKAEQAAMPVGEGMFTQEQMDATKADYEAKLASVHAELVFAQETIAKVTSDDETDKAAIAEGQAKLEAIKTIVAPAPVVEAPIESPVTEEQVQA